MISVVFTRGPDYVGLEVMGHANAGPHGEDMVCAAVSTLAQTCIASMVAAGFEPEYIVEPGDMICICRYRPGKKMAWEFIDTAPDEDVVLSAIMHTIYTGMAYIEEHYPQHVAVVNR